MSQPQTPPENLGAQERAAPFRDTPPTPPGHDVKKNKPPPKKLTAQKIGEVLEKAPRHIRRVADRENWPVLETPNAKGGGIIKLYALSSLPQDIQLAVQSQYVVESQNSSNTPAISTNAEELPEWADEIAHARFNLVKALLDEKDNAKARGGKKTEALNNFIESYNNGLIYASLHKILGGAKRSTVLRWEKNLKESGMDYRALAPKWGQHRAGKNRLTEAEKVRFEIELLNDKRVKVDTAIYHTKIILEHEGVESPSGKATFRAYVNTIKKRRIDVWTLAREGEKALVDKVLPSLIRDITKIEVGEVLVADGHRCSFTAINPLTGKPARPLLIVFYDWKSGNIAGAYIDFQENVQVIHNALRNAIINLGKIPKFVYLDNGKAFKSKFFTEKEIDFKTAKVQGVYARLGIKTIFAKPYNARAKVVERFFEELENSFSRQASTFVGTCITGKPAGMNRNEGFTSSLNPRKSYALEDVYRAMAVWHEMFHKNRPHPHFKGKTKGEIFEAGRGPGVDESKLHYLMMNAEIKKIYPTGVKMLGAFFWHENLYGLRDKVIAKYDLNDISKIHVYLAATGGFLCTATRWQEVHPIARHTGSPKDQAELKRKLKIQAGLKKDTKKLLRRIKENHGSLDTFQPLLEAARQNALPEYIEGTGQDGAFDLLEPDVFVETESRAEKEPEPQGEGGMPFFPEPMDKYKYLISLDRDLTEDEITWAEEEFYPSIEGEQAVEWDGRLISRKGEKRRGLASPAPSQKKLNRKDTK